MMPRIRKSWQRTELPELGLRDRQARQNQTATPRMAAKRCASAFLDAAIAE